MKKRSIIITVAAVLLIVGMLVGCGKANDNLPVSKDKAKEIAITQLGITAEDASYAVVTKAGNESEPYYVVEVLLQGVVYRYSIDPQTGDIQKLTINDQNVELDAQPVVPSVSSDEYIGYDKAKQIALSESGLTEADINKIDFEMDFAYGRYLYDIEFSANGHKYEYEIWADSGEIFQKNVDKVTVIEPSVEETTFIGVQRAKEIALAHAEVKNEAVVFESVEWDLLKGSAVYEVEFSVNFVEYEYKINAVTGEVIKHSVKTDKGSNRNESQTNDGNGNSSEHISVEEAKRIALSHAGVSASDAKFKATELDFERGIEVYEIEFKVDRIEYEYEINARTGEVVKAERDYDD